MKSKPTPTADSTGVRKPTTITTSTDGKWETFHKHAGLMRYVPSGIFFARLKISGKPRRDSLETNVLTVALDKLALKRQQWRKSTGEVGALELGVERYKEATEGASDIKDVSKDGRCMRLNALLRSWPELGKPGVGERGWGTGSKLRADAVTKKHVEDWFDKYDYAPVACNATLELLREVLTLAGLPKEQNPTTDVKRKKVGRKQLCLPTVEQFEQIVELVATGKGGVKACAALLRFLAYSGTRISEAKQCTWGDVNWEKNHLVVHCAKRRVNSRELLLRNVPLVPAMQLFLRNEMRAAAEAGREIKATDRICRKLTCERSLKRACDKVGLPKLTHHSFRHLFATFCIEAGIDIPTVSRWLGHSDGGALAMRVYGHLREEHSQLMASKVTFGLPPAPQQAALA